uniref:Uncharacterized protein n=1 Tax=viral metagenome TaxID=1070528 RepID=A0A6C0DCU1_9ZZZZ
MPYCMKIIMRSRNANIEKKDSNITDIDVCQIYII